MDRFRVHQHAADDEIEVTDDDARSFDSSGDDDTTSCSQTSSEGVQQTRREEERAVFQKARHYLLPGPFYRAIVHLYAERKLLVFFWIHFVSTMIVWAHFAMIKFEQQSAAVPEAAPRYWWKVLAPSLEFGSMHAILFQMALLPVTMSRFSISALSESLIDRIVPLNRTLRMHIHLGYTMIIIVFFATIFFFIFFGLLCSDGDQAFCDKFTSEIMITGYAILASLLIIGGTSYWRHKIPYELFYAIHHLVFIMYFVTIAHTLDMEQRRGIKERSQTFKWFSSTLLFYLCDRAAMHLNHRYKTRLLGSSVVSGTNGSKMVILKLSQPVLFRFKPGQYAFLRVDEIDNHWHPFSIASGPDSSQLEFYIEVRGDKSWTKKLWTLLQEENEKIKVSSLRLFVEVMGPYGTSLAKTDDFSHILAIGAGTGIVPIISLFKQHVRNLLRLDPKKYFKELREYEDKMIQVEEAEQLRKGSVAEKVAFGSLDKKNEYSSRISSRDMLSSSIRRSIVRHDELYDSDKLRGNMRDMKKAASMATRSIYGVVALTALPVMGVGLLALTISWNTIPIDIKPGMVDILKFLTMLFQSLFAGIAIFVWDGNTFLTFIDMVMCILSPFADWNWVKVCDKYGSLRFTDIVAYSLLVGYMTARVWAKAVMPRHKSRSAEVGRFSVNRVNKLDVVWTTRSASLVSEILPDLLDVWETLGATWGAENSLEVCRISIYVTDRDQEACSMLRRELLGTDLYQSGAIYFGRPDLPKTIEDHTIDVICTKRKSYSLLAFCGSPSLGREIHHHKISNDMITAITGNKRHQMEFVSESYGGVKASKKIKVDERESEMENMQPLTTRRDMSYFTGRGLPSKRNSFRIIRDVATEGLRP